METRSIRENCEHLITFCLNHISKECEEDMFAILDGIVGTLYMQCEKKKEADPLDFEFNDLFSGINALNVGQFDGLDNQHNAINVMAFHYFNFIYKNAYLLSRLRVEDGKYCDELAKQRSQIPKNREVDAIAKKVSKLHINYNSYLYFLLMFNQLQEETTKNTNIKQKIGTLVTDFQELTKKRRTHLVPLVNKMKTDLKEKKLLPQTILDIALMFCFYHQEFDLTNKLFSSILFCLEYFFAQFNEQEVPLLLFDKIMVRLMSLRGESMLRFQEEQDFKDARKKIDVISEAHLQQVRVMFKSALDYADVNAPVFNLLLKYLGRRRVPVGQTFLYYRMKDKESVPDANQIIFETLLDDDILKQNAYAWGDAETPNLDTLFEVAEKDRYSTNSLFIYICVLQAIIFQTIKDLFQRLLFTNEIVPDLSDEITKETYARFVICRGKFYIIYNDDLLDPGNDSLLAIGILLKSIVDRNWYMDGQSIQDHLSELKERWEL